MNHFHYDMLLPDLTTYIVYYGNSYELLQKHFNAKEYADHFVEQLKKEKGLLEFVEMRIRTERIIKRGDTK